MEPETPRAIPTPGSDTESSFSVQLTAVGTEQVERCAHQIWRGQRSSLALRGSKVAALILGIMLGILVQIGLEGIQEIILGGSDWRITFLLWAVFLGVAIFSYKAWRRNYVTRVVVEAPDNSQVALLDEGLAISGEEHYGLAGWRRVRKATDFGDFVAVPIVHLQGGAIERYLVFMASDLGGDDGKARFLQELNARAKGKGEAPT